jgi:hypothetical protein
MNFNEVEVFVKDKLKQYSLNEWTFKWNFSRRYFGMCSYQKKQIILSKLFVVKNSHIDTIDTALHEIAHAIAGPNTGHNKLWKNIAKNLGAIPKATYDGQKIIIPYRYELVCINCNFKTYKNKISKHALYYHPTCSTKTKQGIFKYKTL